MITLRQFAESALADTNVTPGILRELATACEEAGLAEEARRLHARTALRTAPLPVHEERRRRMLAALSSGDATLCDELADAFEALGMTCSVRVLRKRAAELRGEDAEVSS